MAIQTGYKASELGEIPQDWDVVELGDILKIKHGKNQKEVESPNGTYPILATGGQIGWATEYLYDKPSVLIGRKGTIDKPRYQDTPFWTVDTLFYSEIGTSCSAKFIFYKFCLIDWIKNNEASGVPSQNAKTIEKIQISLPPLPEQTAIAAALSDTDALIGSLKTLIAKKQAVKLSAMQNLLGGKIRLPAFAQRPDGSPKTTRQTELGLLPEDWEVVELGEVLKIRHGKNQKEVENPNGTYPILATGGQIGWSIEYLYDKPSVLIGRKGTIDKPRYQDTPFWTVDTLFYSEIKANCSAKFIFYKFCLIDWIKNNEASGVPSQNARTIEKVQISLPLLPEQTAIAQLLSDMDAEIEALECRLKKTQSLKQGMMQALLSGKIRLPLE